MNKLQAGSKGLRKYTLYWPLFFLGPFIICFLAFNLFPILFTLRTSFFEWDGMADKVFVGLANYKRVLLEDANFRKSIVYTLRIMLLSYPISIFLGLLMAACLSNLKRGRHVPLRYNNDKRKKPLFSRGLSVCRHLFNSFSKLKYDEKIIE